MARTGRPKSVTQRINTHVGLTPEHRRKLELLDWDPFLGKRDYGSFNRHIERALEEYFQKHYPELQEKDLTGDK